MLSDYIYFIYIFDKSNTSSPWFSIDIRNVCALYTFDQEAKKEMSISFDPRIQLHGLGQTIRPDI